MIVTHNMQQAQRVSDRCAFFLAAENEPGRVVEQGPTDEDVHQPRRPAHARLRHGTVRMTPPTPVVSPGGVPGRGRSWPRLRPRRRSTAAAPRPGSTAPGSTYVALAMQQWVADGQVDGLSINYLPTGSPSGLGGSPRPDRSTSPAPRPSSRRSAASEPSRGYQYVPDVAGAVAVMYNVEDKAGSKVDYLRLSRVTVARIFMGDISRWSDPAITADNHGPACCPDEPITVVYRSASRAPRRSSTTSWPTPRPASSPPWAATQPACRRRSASSSSTARPTSPPRPQAFNGVGADRPVHRQRLRQVVDRLRRVRLRQGLRRRRGLDRERGRQLGAARTPRTSRPRWSRPRCGPT